MERKKRPIIAINIKNGEVKQFASETEAGKGLGVAPQAIQIARMWGGTCKEWRVYDTPENIGKRIARLEEEIEYLNSIGIN